MSYRICRHIKTDGLQCQAPALREDTFCYFHTTLRRRHRTLASTIDKSTMRPMYDRDGKFNGMEPIGQPSGGIQLGLLEDTTSVQIAISTVIHALATNRLEVRRATALLYGLQLAASNCRTLRKDGRANPDAMLRHVVSDQDGECIAPSGLQKGETWSYREPATAPVNHDPADTPRADDAEDAAPDPDPAVLETGDQPAVNETPADGDSGDCSPKFDSHAYVRRRQPAPIGPRSGDDEEAILEDDEKEDEDEDEEQDEGDDGEEEAEADDEEEDDDDEVVWNEAFRKFRAQVFGELGSEANPSPFARRLLNRSVRGTYG